VNSGIRVHSSIVHDNKKVGQARIFQKRAEILSVMCILVSGRIYGIVIVYGLCEYMSLISFNTNLF
jgi:hypothetical protein